MKLNPLSLSYKHSNVEGELQHRKKKLWSREDKKLSFYDLSIFGKRCIIDCNWFFSNFDMCLRVKLHVLIF
jgi:hypothetical protein